MDISGILNLFSDESYYQRDFKFYVIILFVTIFTLFTKFWASNTQVILVVIVIVFATWIVNAFVGVAVKNLSDFNKQTYIKLETLQSKVDDYISKKIEMIGISGMQLSTNDKKILEEKNNLDYLYIDSSMVYFLYSILPLYDYNPDEFYMLLKGTNNILKIRKEIEDYYSANSKMSKDEETGILPSFRDHLKHRDESLYIENINEMYEIAIQLKINCLNNIQNIIYGVPKLNKMYKYIDDSIERYSVLISKNLEVINLYHLREIKEVGINTRTKFVSYKGTKPYDRMANQNIIPSKLLADRSEIHQLYV